MLLLLLRFIALTFLPENITSSKMRILARICKTVILVFSVITPKWLNTRSAELYACFLVFIIRYYILPVLFGYELTTPASLPFEYTVTSSLADLQAYLR